MHKNLLDLSVLKPTNKLKKPLKAYTNKIFLIQVKNFTVVGLKQKLKDKENGQINNQPMKLGFTLEVLNLK